MRKALASAALAAMLSIGIGTTAVAHAAGVTATQEVNADNSDDDGGVDAGLFGLLGLLGLAGLLGRGGGGGRAKGGGSGGRGYTPPRAPKGGHTTDWSSR